MLGFHVKLVFYRSDFPIGQATRTGIQRALDTGQACAKLSSPHLIFATILSTRHPMGSLTRCLGCYQSDFPMGQATGIKRAWWSGLLGSTGPQPIGPTAEDIHEKNGRPVVRFERQLVGWVPPPPATTSPSDAASAAATPSSTATVADTGAQAQANADAAQEEQAPDAPLSNGAQHPAALAVPPFCGAADDDSRGRGRESMPSEPPYNALIAAPGGAFPPDGLVRDDFVAAARPMYMRTAEHHSFYPHTPVPPPPPDSTTGEEGMRAGWLPPGTRAVPVGGAVELRVAAPSERAFGYGDGGGVGAGRGEEGVYVYETVGEGEGEGKVEKSAGVRGGQRAVACAGGGGGGGRGFIARGVFVAGTCLCVLVRVVSALLVVVAGPLLILLRPASAGSQARPPSSLVPASSSWPSASAPASSAASSAPASFTSASSQAPDQWPEWDAPAWAGHRFADDEGWEGACGGVRDVVFTAATDPRTEWSGDGRNASTSERKGVNGSPSKLRAEKLWVEDTRNKNTPSRNRTVARAIRNRSMLAYPADVEFLGPSRGIGGCIQK
ncbi:hypothetical protein DFH09DRAFT_1072922 [Mycena vulgaris]|nr:hypothetical protein DFH09DRAFT_1072922 [Mycena vulgaris]